LLIIFQNVSIVLAFLALSANSQKPDIITGSNYREFLNQAETNYGVEDGYAGRGGVGRHGGNQDKAFVVGSSYKVADGVLDGSFGGVTHRAKGIVLGWALKNNHPKLKY
jgi:hypothetical protein